MNWEQFRAILWLRWRLTRNQTMRAGGLGAVIAALAGVALVMIALGLGVGATLIGALVMQKATARVVMFVWDGVTFGVLFFWLIGVLTELQRSESIDLARLLHLPIGLKQVFVFNYLISLVSVGTVLGSSAMLGLALGLAISQGWRFLLALPLVIAFVFMVSAWIYCLRGWLLSLMVNPRRRRSIIMWITLGIILLGQSPQLINLVFQRGARAEREARRAAQHESGTPQTHEVRQRRNEDYFQQLGAVVTKVHPWIPVLWLPNGARGLAAGKMSPAIWGGAGMLLLGWMGISRAYRATLRFYRADERVKPAKISQETVAAVGPRSPPATNWVERKLPWLPDDAAALALAQCRSMTRAPEIRMMLALALFFTIFFPVMLFWRGGMHISDVGKPFMGTGVVVMVLFMLVQLVCNQFGCDRDGFRGLVLLPTPRQRLLLGKNLALLPFAAATALVPFVAVSVFARMPVLVVAAMIAQFAAAFLLFCLLGNLSSILAPYRIAPGSLKPTKRAWQTTLFTMLIHMLFPLAIAPVFIPPALGWVAEHFGGVSAALVDLLAAVVMAVAFGILYLQTLKPLGRMLLRRETRILRAVTEVRE